MRRYHALERLINVLLGAAWALSVMLAALGFFLFSPYGFFSGVIATFLFAFVGLFFVVLLEYVLLRIQGERERIKQTELFASLLDELRRRP